ncbi:hypothetical protein C2E23DRAFT_130565 [Lenzites betulinus]|nr:hypothetical protein C2E23DRAFT_130565 [Lenzites betulinus]
MNPIDIAAKSSESLMQSRSRTSHHTQTCLFANVNERRSRRIAITTRTLVTPTHPSASASYCIHTPHYVYCQQPTRRPPSASAGPNITVAGNANAPRPGSAPAYSDFDFLPCAPAALTPPRPCR